MCVISSGRIGRIVELDNRDNDALHIVEYLDTDNDERVDWVPPDNLMLID